MPRGFDLAAAKLRLFKPVDLARTLPFHARWPIQENLS
jgi:hypothetical protein